MEFDAVSLNRADPPQENHWCSTMPSLEEEFSTILDHIAEAFFALNLNGSCTYANQSAERLLGAKRADWLHQPLWQIFDVDSSSQLYQQCDRVLTELICVEFEEFYPSLNHWFAVRLIPSPKGCFAYFQDINQLKQIEAALGKEQDFLNILLDQVQAGIVACDADGQLKLFNKAARSFHGLVAQPLPPQQWAEQYDLYLPDGKSPMAPEDIPLYRALQGEQVVEVEMMIRPKPGQARHLLASGQAIYNLSGKKQGAVVVMHDITERKHTEAALRESEARLSSIFQTIPDGIIILNPQGQIITANAAAEKILRLTSSDLRARGYNDPAWAITTVDGQPFPEEELPFVQVIRTGKAVERVEHAIAHPDGTKIILSINASPLLDAHGQIVHVIAAISDITERKRAEVALQASEERYRSVIETAAEGIVLQTADGNIFTCNASAERILGLTAAQMMGRSSLDPRWCAIYEDGSPFPGELHPAMVTLRTGDPQTNVTMGIRKPEGSLTWISINTRPLFQPDSATPVAVVSTFFDITESKQAEAELLISDTALQQMPDAILLTDLQGNIQRWLGKAEQIFGYTAPEAIGRPVNFLHHPDIKARMTADIIQALQTTGEFWGEIPCIRKDGSGVLIETTAKTVHDKAGQPIFLIGINKDITERKQAEAERAELIRQQVQEQTARLEAEADLRRSSFLVEVSTTLSSSLDYAETLQSVAWLAVPYFADWCAVDLLNDDGTISRVAVAHPDPEKVKLGWELIARFPKHIEDGYGIAEVIKTGKSQLAIEITDAQLTAAVPHPEYRDILRGLGLRSSITAPLHNRGRVLGSISFVISESHRQYSSADLRLAEELARRAAIAIDNARLYHMAQQAQQAAEIAADRTARLQRVTAALSESLTPAQVAEVIVEQSMAVLQAAAALVVLVSSDRTELEIVKSIGYAADLVDSWSRFSINTDVPLAEAIRTGEPVWVEDLLARIARYPHLAPIYRRYDFQSWIALPLVVESKSVGGLLLSFQEFKQLSQADREFILALTRQCAQAIVRAQLYEAERQARAEAEQANRVKDEFLAVLSHELRSPLNPILGWTKLLQSQPFSPDKAAKALATIERNVKLQAQLIEDLLDVSRILQGKMVLNVTSVNLVSVIEAALETVRLSAETKAIQLETLMEPEIDPILGDPARLQQIVWNLLTNGVKFTPQGGRVTVRLQRVDTFAQLQVQDTGKGINAAFLPHVFDYFRQEDGTTTRKFGGLGLGLAIVRHLTEQHGGTVAADSPGEGLGATFTIRLPLQAKATETAAPHPPPAAELDLSQLNILIVDDEADMRELMQFMLEQQGAQVNVASSAIEALLICDRHPPDLLISDIGMPEMDGYTLMQQIRHRSPEQGGGVPAIALTAYAGEYDQQQALKVGFQQHVAKPIEPEELIRAIAALVNTP
uniref:histidine kinase n=1 Tax=Cyanothece sp. (strain PCC 7425 / ATCC 29141) TaxID=395961 RepID=B8HS58_CYAP4